MITRGGKKEKKKTERKQKSNFRTGSLKLKNEGSKNLLFSPARLQASGKISYGQSIRIYPDAGTFFVSII